MDQVSTAVTTLNFGELSGAPYGGAGHSAGGGGGSDTESSEAQVKSLMELQAQQGGLPGYGHYRSLYNNGGGNHEPGFPGNRGHLGYPFPPMPGQNYSGYPHLGYPSSQSPGPREGMKLNRFASECVWKPFLRQKNWCVKIMAQRGGLHNWR